MSTHWSIDLNSSHALSEFACSRTNLWQYFLISGVLMHIFLKTNLFKVMLYFYRNISINKTWYFLDLTHCVTHSETCEWHGVCCSQFSGFRQTIKTKQRSVVVLWKLQWCHSYRCREANICFSLTTSHLVKEEIK